jgi:hypothetical protein
MPRKKKVKVKLLLNVKKKYIVLLKAFILTNNLIKQVVSKIYSTNVLCLQAEFKYYRHRLVLTDMNMNKKLAYSYSYAIKLYTGILVDFLSRLITENNTCPR